MHLEKIQACFLLKKKNLSLKISNFAASKEEQMFVHSNQVSEIKKYFRSKLQEKFSETEIKRMFQDLLQKRLNLSREELLFSDELRLSESDLLYFRSIAAQLLENKPFQYLIGEAHFCELVLDCDKRALIPRPETEELVHWMLEDTTIKQARILDLCTGSGCIALALKNNLPEAEVSGIDVSREALDLARQNAAKTQLKVQFDYADALNLSEMTVADKYDYWVSNPPYIPQDESRLMHPNVLQFEPHLALFVPDNDALQFYRAIATQALQALNPGGKLYFEIHENYAQEVEKLCLSLGFQKVEIKVDMQRKARMLKAELNQGSV